MSLELSVVVPVYRSAATLPLLLERLQAELAPRYSRWEAVLVNDGSPDGSWEVLTDLVQRYNFLVIADLRKNCGQDNALMAGLRLCQGEVAIIMDDDLQHDPADIPRLVDKLHEGWDVCFAAFGAKRQAWWKNLGSRFNGWAAQQVIQKPAGIYLSPFKALARGVIDEVLAYQGPFPYLDGLLLSATSRFTQIEVAHHARPVGHGNYNLPRSVAVWLKLATGFSVRPLRIASVAGLFTAFLALAFGFGLIVRHLLGHEEVEGWTSTLVVVSFLGGLQLFCLGLLGEYVGRAYLVLGRKPQAPVRCVLRRESTELGS